MKISLRWLNRHLQPNITSAEAETVLTNVGFPIESIQDHSGWDQVLDVEVTSNRGDVLSHIGCAREIAAATGRVLSADGRPEPARHGDVRQSISLVNRAPDACPIFTVQTISGVTIAPSPGWLVELLGSIGQRSINNVVDVTNFICHGLGQPCHAFDLDRLEGRQLVVRWAKQDEALTTLDGKKRVLRPDELVVADATRAQSLAGVIGGADSQVTQSTRNIALEVATWEPTTVRRAARRHQLRTDASHRFERFVAAGAVQGAARAAAALMHELAGGTLAGGGSHGLLIAGAPIPGASAITLRPSRATKVLGFEIPVAEMLSILRSLDVDAIQASQDAIQCVPPAWRPDLEREIDLIEELVRIAGLARVPSPRSLPVTLWPIPPEESARRAAQNALASLGFMETVAFSFLSDTMAARFLPTGLELVRVDDERRKGEPALRPSVIPSLLGCRKANQDARVSAPGGVRLFETASRFAQRGSQSLETRCIALVLDVPGATKGKPATLEQRQEAVRLARGAVEAVVGAIAGPGAEVRLESASPSCAAWDAQAWAAVRVGQRVVGGLGLIAEETRRAIDLDTPMVGAELEIDAILGLGRERAPVEMPPEYPGIERDVSVVISDEVTWSSVDELVRSTRVQGLRTVGFVGTFRGKQVPPGKKSMTIRLSFRDDSRTLRHEEVDPQVQEVLRALSTGLSAQLRA